MRRLAALSLEIRSRSTSISRTNSPRLFNALPSLDSPSKPAPGQPRPVLTEEAGARLTQLPGRRRQHPGRLIHENNTKMTNYSHN